MVLDGHESQRAILTGFRFAQTARPLPNHYRTSANSQTLVRHTLSQHRPQRTKETRAPDALETNRTQKRGKVHLVASSWGSLAGSTCKMSPKMKAALMQNLPISKGLCEGVYTRFIPYFNRGTASVIEQRAKKKRQTTAHLHERYEPTLTAKTKQARLSLVSFGTCLSSRMQIQRSRLNTQKKVRTCCGITTDVIVA